MEELECTKIEKKEYWPPALICHTAVLNPETKKMYVFGGLAKYKTSSYLYELDLTTLEWKRIDIQEPSPAPRSSHAAVFYQGAMIVYGGKNADGDMLGDIWELNLTDFTWKQYELAGEAPKVVWLLSIASIWTFDGCSRR